MRTPLHEAYYVYKRTNLYNVLDHALIEFELTLGNALPSQVRKKCLMMSLSELDRLKYDEPDPTEILSTLFQYRGYGPYRSIAPLQIRTEFLQFMQLLEDHNISNILEIGTARGGTFYALCRLFSDAESIVSLDLPGGKFGGGYSKSRISLYRQFTTSNNTYFVRRNSHDIETLEIVKDTIQGNPDFIFIDGDHTYTGVKQDFKMYSELASPGSIIAFHDIMGNRYDPAVGVKEFWSEIKHSYRTEEIIRSQDQEWGGIGIIYYE